MHEFSITSLIIEEIVNSTEIQQTSKIKQVTIGLGPFTHATFDRIQWWWDNLTESYSSLKGTELVKQDLSGVLYCEHCNIKSIIENDKVLLCDTLLDLYSCPKCQSLQTKIISGEEIKIISVEVYE